MDDDIMSKINISKMIKAILRVAVGVIQFAVSLFFVVALFSGITTVMNFAATIEPTTAILNYSNSNNVSVTIPFYFNNTGLYDVNELTITIDVNIHNITDDFDVLNGSEQFSVGAGTILNTTLVFDNGVLAPNLVAGLLLNSTGYNMTLFASIGVNYAFNLIPLWLNVTADVPFNITG